MNTLQTFGVLTFNFERGVYLEEQLEFLTHHPAIGRIDLLLANELDVGCSRSGNRDIPALIAARLGLKYVFGLEFTELVGENNEKGHHGNAVFSRWPILESRCISLPVQYDWFYDRQKRTGGRQAILARIEVEDKQLGVVCTHLENRTTPEGRWRQLQFLLEEAERCFSGLPVILGGDLNTCGFHGGDKETMSRLVGDESFAARHLSAPESLEPGLLLAAQRGFAAVPPLQAPRAYTRRKPVGEGLLALRVDWLLLRQLDCRDFAVLSTRKEDFLPISGCSGRSCFAGPELSDHNVVYTQCRLPCVSTKRRLHRV